jgi:hypothetical protein
MDYSVEFEKLISIAETISKNLTEINSTSKEISASLSTLAASNGRLEQHHEVIRNLAEGPGIHSLGPYEWFNLIPVYRLLIEQANALQTGSATEQQKQEAIKKIREYSAAISAAIPREF